MTESILFVCISPSFGGAERSLLDLLSEVRRKPEFTASLVGFPWTLFEVPPKIGEIEGMDYQFPFSGNHSNSLSVLILQSKSFIHWIREFRRRLRDCSPSLIHANGSRALLLSSLAKQRIHVPLVFHCRDYLKDTWLSRFLLSRADYTLVATEFMRNRLVEGFRYPEERVFNVGNPVEKPNMSPVDQSGLAEELGLPKRTRFVTMVAQLAAWKRHDCFVQAAARLSSEFSDVHFLMVGKDLWNTVSGYEQDLRNLVWDLGLEDRASFLGHREDVGKILSESTVMVLPSLHEPFGRVVIEAWWMGTPAVVSDCGGPREMVENGVSGFHFRSGDAEDLGDKIRRLLTDSNLKEGIVNEARKRVGIYSPAVHGKAVMSVYDRILS